MSAAEKDDDKACLVLRDAWYEEAKAQTMQTLPAFLQKLHDHHHDYNTICYAVAAAAVGAAWAIKRGPQGGITGFQAGAIMWEFMGAWNGVKGPARLLDYENLLYPQYDYKFRTITDETWQWAQKRAAEHLAAKESFASPAVVAHWKSIVAGDIPFGLTVGED